MNKQIRKLCIFTALILLVSSNLVATAKEKRWREFMGRPLIRFDWNCASPSAYPGDKLSRVVQAALKRDYAGVQTYADRAFVFDLNGDHKPEYFVPLVCGATGNCTWGMFALNPTKFLGVVNGEYIYVHKLAGSYPDIITYAHMSAAEGSLATYSFRKRRYVWLGDNYPTDFRGGLFGIKVPGFLDKACAGCERLGY